MKKRTGFVTNSSSASFIMYIESDETDLNVFEKLLTEYISHERDYEYGAGTHHSKPFIRKISTNTFKIEEHTAMYNGFEDIPSYMIDLMIRSNMTNNFTESRHNDISFIKGVKFEINDD